MASKTEKVASSANGVESTSPKKFRCYNQLFDGPTFGMQLVLYKGRPFVAQKTINTSSKPAVGDVLVAINGSTLPLLSDIGQITGGLKRMIGSGSVELTFMEVGFKPYSHQQTQQQMVSRPAQSQGAHEVIELSDDDD